MNAAAILVSPGAGRLTALDTAAARAVPGVLAVLRAADCPALTDTPRHAGAPVAAVVAETAAIARAALAVLAPVYDHEPPVVDPAAGRVLSAVQTGRPARADATATVTAARRHLPDLTPPAALETALARAVGRPLRLSLPVQARLTTEPAGADRQATIRLTEGPDGAVVAADLALRLNAGAVAVARALAPARLAGLPGVPLSARVEIVATGTPPTLLPPTLPPAAGAACPATAAALELALLALARAQGRDPLDLRRQTLPDGPARACLDSVTRHWQGPLNGAPLDDEGRLTLGAGIAVIAHPATAVLAEVMADRDTGHVSLTRLVVALDAAPGPAGLLPAAVARAHGHALREEAALDPATGAVLAGGLADYRLAHAFSLPEIEAEWLGQTHADPETVTAAAAAAILSALADATGIAPGHLPMTPDRVLSPILSAPKTRE